MITWAFHVYVISVHVYVTPIQELSDQQLKQMLLAYMMLIMKGRAMLQQDLDDACEVGGTAMSGD